MSQVGPEPVPRSFARPSWLPYVAPMAAFLVLTELEGRIAVRDGSPDPTWYPLAYTSKVVIVTVVFILCRSTWRDLRRWPDLGSLGLAIAVGLAVTIGWVGLDGHYPPLPFLGGTRAGFDPGRLAPVARLGFLATRLYGLVLLVPAFEELFWRSFGIRYVVDPDFERVPIGKVTPMAALLTSAVFALAHPLEWLPAFLTGLAWAWLVHRTKSLSACVVSHVAANLGLGVYVLATGSWHFW